VIVDDDDLSRRGLSELLGDRPELQVLDSLNHEQAVQNPRWDAVDVAVVDAADARLDGDQFPGVAVVENIRAKHGENTTVIVMTGHFFDDALRRRMREAGADYYYNRIELQDSAALYQAVLNCEHGSGRIPPEQDLDQAVKLGVTDRTKVNEGVRFVQEHSLTSELDSDRTKGVRARLRYRRTFGQQAQLHAVNSDGRTPEREQDAPSVLQIQRFWDWATKVKGRH
jgi:DNA-binding NarL/FixJ family response regulator